MRVGGAWQCTRCGQRWDVLRLATAAAYAAVAAYAARMPIPGTRELDTLTSRVAGSGGFAAAGMPPVVQIGSSMDAATIAAHEREGGGAPSERRVATGEKS